jgi:hypothetical protein
MRWRIGLRLRVWWSHWALDSRLAAGADPASDPALTMRAAQLGSIRHRRRLAASIDRLARESRAPQVPALTSAVPIVRQQVAVAQDSLLFLAHLLRDAERVHPRGIAMVQRLLTDGGSVLYEESARGVVELKVRGALDCLVEQEAVPEAWFSVSNSNARGLVGSDP